MGIVCSKDGQPIIIEKPEEPSRLEEEDQTETQLRKKALQKIQFIDKITNNEINSPLFKYVQYENPTLKKLQEFHKQYKFSQMDYFNEQELKFYNEVYKKNLKDVSSVKLNKKINCKVFEEIGCGSYGKIQKAFDTNNRKIMAVKCMLKSKNHNEEYLKSFQKEIEFLQTLNHKHIIKYYGFYQTKNYFKIYLEYMSEGSIFDLIQQYGPLSEELTSIYTKQILLGLEYLHCQNIIHRDIKAANVLVGDCVKLSDFGTAKQIENSYLNSQIGTKCWMAPEVLKNGEVYERFADIWSLGCTVYEMVTGKPPFYHDNPVSQKVQNI